MLDCRLKSVHLPKELEDYLEMVNLMCSEQCNGPVVLSILGGALPCGISYRSVYLGKIFCQSATNGGGSLTPITSACKGGKGGRREGGRERVIATTKHCTGLPLFVSTSLSIIA